MAILEEWRVCPSYPKIEASNLGRVRNAQTKRVRLAKPNARGYTLINFWHQKKLVARSLHWLIADAFLGDRPLGAQVRHLDGNPRNNAASNLAYGSARENARDRIMHGKNPHGERNGMAKLPDLGAEIVRLAYSHGLGTQRQLAALFGMSQAQVNNIVLNKQRRRAA